MENVDKKKKYCDALECEIMDIVVEVLKPILGKFKVIPMNEDGTNIYDSLVPFTAVVQFCHVII